MNDFHTKRTDFSYQCNIIVPHTWGWGTSWEKPLGAWINGK